MYDYVIVGAGSAGCVLANRLSEAHDVLVLEAGGPDERREISIPAAFSELFETGTDWAYYTEPQDHLHGRELYWPRGKTLGGSSSINAMIYIRGNPADYDAWAERGNEGWGYGDLLPYFRRAEHNEVHGETDVHGGDGPLNVTDQRSPRELSNVYLEAAEQVGFSRTDDFNDGEQTGVGLYQVTQKGGTRHSAADAYLKPALGRSTLDAETGAHVTRVLFDGREAAGVEFEQDGDRKRVEASEEVLLCGGAINSPQLLMLSGVGPADHLAEHGIDAVADRPGVGRNLQDHLSVPVVYDCEKPASLADAESVPNLLRYLLFKRGPLTSNVGEGGGFFRSDRSLDAPDLQFHFGPNYFVDHGREMPEGHGFTLGPTLLTPESSGEIRLRSADPFDHPTIDPDYLAEAADVERLVEGVRVAREVLRAEPFDEYRGAERMPGIGVETDEGLAAHVREQAETLYHPVGTCRMGTDDGAVVDDRLRVHGVESLRVVDASVMPDVVRGNTNAPTIAIAERAADLVREDASASESRSLLSRLFG
jgi:choline dehydrogenase